MTNVPMVIPDEDLLPDLLRDDEISPETAAMIASAVPKNTSRAYAHDRAAFRRWCARVRRSPLPATPETVAEYARFLAAGGAIVIVNGHETRKGPAAPNTIDRALSAIRTEHREHGYSGQPELRGARMVIKAIRNMRADDGLDEDGAAPLTVDALRAIAESCDPTTLAGAHDRALFVLGFALMARRSELVALNAPADVDESDQGLEVRIRRSKTDQEAKGEVVPIHYGSHPETCPVRTLRAWRTKLAERRPGPGPLWVPIDANDRMPHEPGFAGRKGTGRLTGKGVGLSLVSAAKRAGVDTAGLSAHSLRVGGASAAYEAGNDLVVISRRGRWKDGSPVLLRYIREVDKWKNNPMKGVL